MRELGDSFEQMVNFQLLNSAFCPPVQRPLTDVGECVLDA